MATKTTKKPTTKTPAAKAVKPGDLALIDAAKDLNAVLSLEPALNLKLAAHKLREELGEVIEILKPEDLPNLAPATRKVLGEIDEAAMQGLGWEPEEEEEPYEPHNDTDDDEDDDGDEEEHDAPPAKAAKGKKAAPAAKPVKEPKAKPAAKAKTPKEPKVKGPRKDGVIRTIFALLKKKPMVVDDLVAALAEKFPDREPEKMRTTVRIQTRPGAGLAAKDGKGRLTVTEQAIEKFGL